jgi:AcrR family transcriptional regulator
MSENVKPRRRYDSSRRQDQARKSRWDVLMAARELWLDQGYAATTLGEIATSAGVSVETIYKAFTNKAGVLKALFDVTVAGDDEPVPMAERADIRAMIAEPAPGRKLDMYAEHTRLAMARVAPVQLMLRAAAGADPAAAAVWRKTRDELLDGMTQFAQDLRRTGGLSPGLPSTQARDILWTCFSIELYELLVLERDWPSRRYASFVAETAKNALLR